MAFDDGDVSRTDGSLGDGSFGTGSLSGASAGGADLVIRLLAELSFADTIAVMRAGTDTLAAVAPRDLDGTGALALFDGTYELGDRLAAIAAQALPVVETDYPWPTEARTFPNWISRRVHLTHYRAQRMTRLGRALRDELPLTAAAIVTGGPDRINLEQAEILTTCAATSQVRRDALVDSACPAGEQYLLTEARTCRTDEFRRIAKRWAAMIDPEADDRGFTEATDREYLDVAGTTGRVLPDRVPHHRARPAAAHRPGRGHPDPRQGRAAHPRPATRRSARQPHPPHPGPTAWSARPAGSSRT